MVYWYMKDDWKVRFMKPVIGVPLRYTFMSDGRPILYLGEKVRRTIQKAGGDVFSIVPVQDVDYVNTRGSEFLELTLEEKKIINRNLDYCDGVFFPGGIKFTPYDRYLLEVAIEKKIPVLAVCLGMQMMSCYDEDVKLESNESGILHNQEDDSSLVHEVSIVKDSKLYEIIGKEKIMVNSFHNYHATSNHVYRTVAVSSDGQIEALEYPSNVFNIGVQWHPEISYDFDDNSKKIIDAFIKQAQIRQLSREKLDVFVS